MAARRASYTAMRQLQVAEIPGRLLHGLVVHFAQRNRRRADRGHDVGARLRARRLLRGTRTGDQEQGDRKEQALRHEHGAVYRGSGLAARGSWLVARGWGCDVAEIATTSPQGCGTSGSASTRETDRPAIVSGLRCATTSDMAVVKTYRELEVWQAGMDLVEVVYAVTRTFPRDELFGLTAQTRRATISVPSNIAEGACRRTTGAFLNHVSIALGSHAEVETCLEIAIRLK